MSKDNTRPFLGFGLGLRTEHYQYVIEYKPQVDWFEILSENYMVPGGKPLANLDKIRTNYPMVMHGVSMSIGSTDPLNTRYLKDLKTLIERVEPFWYSDHLCWTHAHNINSHDLLPLPYNETTIQHLVSRINQVQEFIGRPMLIENLSSYVTYNDSEMSEWQFLNEIARRSGCFILLDINNIFVSAHNHQFNPKDYIHGIDKKHVMQFHLAGHSQQDEMLIDTHDHSVCDPVWDLYRYALSRFGAVSTMIERDDNIPSFIELREELSIAEKIASDVLSPEQLIISGKPVLKSAA
ncbi:MAG: DUF692 domain-containing protein [Cycloclasticus sp.]|nr:DUF692 domain-containing protein [Cycloclasticus sp.]